MSGRAWVFGDDIDTDVLAPGIYMKAPIAELASHCLEAVEPAFAREVKPGDIIVGGRNFGIGSSREQAAEALKLLGVAAVVAVSFGGIFFRNAINLGLPARARLTVDAEAGRLAVEDGPELACDPLPPHLLAMIRDGGLIPHLERKLGR